MDWNVVDALDRVKIVTGPNCMGHRGFAPLCNHRCLDHISRPTSRLKHDNRNGKASACPDAAPSPGGRLLVIDPGCYRI